MNDAPTDSAQRDYRDVVPVLDFRAECRAYAQRWMAVQMAELTTTSALASADLALNLVSADR